jgi:uncharacterized protein
MNPVFADTSYYIALLDPSDYGHDAAKGMSRQIQAPVVTTAWVLAELANTLTAVHRRSLFGLLYEMLRKDKKVVIVPPSEDLFEAGVAFFTQYQDKDWSLTDCISFLVMKKLGAREALTGDHHFEQAGFRALLR